MNKMAYRASLTALCIAIAACTVGPRPRTPEVVLGANFDQISAAQPSAANADPGQLTFRAFASASLDQLLESALQHNTSIASAKARLDEARAYRGLSKFSLFPTVTASGEKDRSKFSTQDPQTPEGLGISDRYEANADVAWEIDLFGSLRNQSAAIWLRADAANAALQDMRRLIVAEVAQGFFAAIGARERVAITQRNLANLRESEGIVQALLDAGRGTDFDLARAKALSLSTVANLASQQAELRRQELRLSTLTTLPVGQIRQLLEQQADLPELLALTAVGTPEQWLRRRPDVQAAELELAAQTRDVGTQIAEYFPKLTLNGGFGSVAQEGGDLFSAGAERWRFGPSLSWRFLDFGRVRQYVKAEQAQVAGAEAAYRETVLRALEETELALSDFRAANESTAALAEAAAQAERARALAELRFEAGASDFLVVLDAQRQRLSLDDQLVQAKTARANAMAQLYKAFAGDFVAQSEKTP